MTTTLKPDDIVILDGGLGTELEFRGYDLSQDPLWSAGLVERDPGALAAIHRSYLEAGADVITAATYQGSIGSMTEHLFAELVRIAVRTRNEFVRDHQAEIEFVGAPEGLGNNNKIDSTSGDANSSVPRRQRRKWPVVAVGMGPYGAYLGKGQEYTGDYGEVSKATLIEFHQRKLEALTAQGIEPELLLFETIPNSLELVAIADLLQQQKKQQPTQKYKVWLALSVRFDKDVTPDGHNRVFLADGTPLTSSESNTVSSLEPQFRALAPYISAIGVNCCPLDKVALALTELGAIFSQSSMSALSSSPPLLIVYPNSGEVYSGETKTWSQPTSQSTDSLEFGNDATCSCVNSCNPKDCSWDLAGNSQTWIKQGARIIGGCCRTRPADIEKLRKTIGERLG